LPGWFGEKGIHCIGRKKGGKEKNTARHAGEKKGISKRTLVKGKERKGVKNPSRWPSSWISKKERGDPPVCFGGKGREAARREHSEGIRVLRTGRRKKKDWLSRAAEGEKRGEFCVTIRRMGKGGERLSLTFKKKKRREL